MTDVLVRSTRGHVAELVFANPPHNHATVEVLAAIADALEAADRDNEVRAVVLGSQGRIFCAGADLSASDAFGGRSEEPLLEFYEQAVRIFAAKKPVVAAVQGAAVGAGLGVAVAADFRVAAPEARFSANFGRLGFYPGFGLTLTLPRLIGQQHAAEMFLTSARYRPEQVAPWGLVDRIAPSGGALEGAHALAAEIAQNAPLSLVAMRAAMRGDLAVQVRERLREEFAAQDRLRVTTDYAEGVASVFERRAANFTGR